jgi:DNA-binding beta-propeller fold protein YncE
MSPDREQRFVYVGNGDDILVLDRAKLEILGSIKPAGLKNGGHQIATDSKGNLYVAQTTMGLQKLTFKGMAPAGK